MKHRMWPMNSLCPTLWQLWSKKRNNFKEAFKNISRIVYLVLQSYDNYAQVKMITEKGKPDAYYKWARQMNWFLSYEYRRKKVFDELPP